MLKVNTKYFQQFDEMAIVESNAHSQFTCQKGTETRSKTKSAVVPLQRLFVVDAVPSIAAYTTLGRLGTYLQ